MTRRRLLIDLAWAAVGYVAVALGVLYFAFAASLSLPVDWPEVVTTILWLAPVGLFLGAFADAWVQP